nr:PD-(D/E)XK nuclease family protein [bacterium]
MSRRSSNTNEYTYQWNPETYTSDDTKRTEPILKISKSSMGSYNWCPKRYEFQYKEGLPIDSTPVMLIGTLVHNAREDFFNTFDVKKAESLSHSELINYCMSLHPIDDNTEMYEAMSIFESNRFMESVTEGTTDNFLPVINEIMLDAKVVIDKNTHPKFELKQDYVVHLQGIIDRMFQEGNMYIPMELKTGGWKDWKTTMMRKEMAFYQLLFENTPEDKLIAMGLDPEIPISHWGWYYPAANYIHIEKVKKSSMSSLKKNIAQLLHSYETGIFSAKYFAKTCANCSFFGICDAANMESWF